MDMAAHIQITAVPPGEAPLWVREKWVGLRLPLLQRPSTPLVFHTFGVLTGPKTFLGALFAFFRGQLKRESGYCVNVRVAVDALASHSPEAAAWWRENTPHMFKATRFFIFGPDVAVAVSEG